MRIALVPGALALSPRYASIEDPVAELRAAVETALDWVGPQPRLLGDAHGVIGELLERSGSSSDGQTADGVVVVANGSATRSEKAPGHFDERALAFDDWLREALTVDPGELNHLDTSLAEELWADVEAIPELATLLGGPGPADFAPAETDPGPQRPRVRLIGVDYDDDPYGVKYWVIRWEVA